MAENPTNGEILAALRNCGSDATAEDCALYIQMNRATHGAPLSTDRLESIRRQIVSMNWPTKFKRTADMIRHLLRNDAGRKLAAAELLKTTEGKIAISEEMAKLELSNS